MHEALCLEALWIMRGTYVKINLIGVRNPKYRSYSSSSTRKSMIPLPGRGLEASTVCWDHHHQQRWGHWSTDDEEGLHWWRTTLKDYTEGLHWQDCWWSGRLIIMTTRPVTTRHHVWLVIITRLGNFFFFLRFFYYYFKTRSHGVLLHDQADQKRDLKMG